MFRQRRNILNTNPWAISNEHKIPSTDYCVETKRNTLKGVFFKKESCFREENSFERKFPKKIGHEIVLLIACFQDETPREIQPVSEQMRLGMVIRMEIRILNGLFSKGPFQKKGLFVKGPFENKTYTLVIEDAGFHTNDHFESLLFVNGL